jgi:glucosamine 6-phosphate synthetase-like amidotransferase/phosphosugar isomerase protein
VDSKERIAVFHNGRIGNYEDLLKELRENNIQVGGEDSS